MVSFGSYLLGAAQLAAVGLSVGFSAYRLRARFLAGWNGAPARLVELIVAVALITWISEILGAFGLFYAGAVAAASVLLAVVLAAVPALSPAGGGGAGVPAARRCLRHRAPWGMPHRQDPPARAPGPWW